jgi:hypothetical protein
MRTTSLLVLAAAGCAYKPGAFSHFRHDFAGQRTTLGCVDLAVDRRPDLIGGGTVIGYQFGNRCQHPAPIDLATARVVARTYDGTSLELSPYDPNGELRPLLIDAHAAGAEAIAYHASERLAEVCVDAASITKTGDAQWLCFASNRPPPGAIDTEDAEVADVAQLTTTEAP